MWSYEKNKALSVAFGQGIFTFLCLSSIWFFAGWSLFVLLPMILISIAIASLSFVWWLTKDRIEVESMLAEVNDLRAENKQLRETNRRLKERVIETEKLLNVTPPKVRKAEAEKPVTQPEAKRLPRNAEAALRIHQAWVLDVEWGSSINRSFLMKNCNLTREDVEGGWDLLNALGFAQKENAADNAKWIVTNTDSHDLSVAIEKHITSAAAGMVHGR